MLMIRTRRQGICVFLSYLEEMLMYIRDTIFKNNKKDENLSSAKSEQGIIPETLNRRKQMENMEALDKIKKRRLDLEKQKQERKDETYRQQRNEEAAQFDLEIFNQQKQKTFPRILFKRERLKIDGMILTNSERYRYT